MTRKLAPKPWPDWFWLISGGIDSVAAYLLTRLALHSNYGKRPIMAYLDTRVGARFNQLYVEQLADHYGEQLWSLRTHEKFEDRVAGRGKYADRDDAGPPGGALHSDVQNELKGRQRELLARGFDVVYVTGIRAVESDARASKPKGEVSRGIRYVKPVYELTKKECAEIILRADAPINLLWILPEVIADCGCLSNGDPSELDKTEELFPEFAQRLREYEEAATGKGVKTVLGWDGLTANEKSAMIHGQTQLSLCEGGCQRERDPAVVRAFKARVEGASIEAAVSELYGQAATA